MLGSTVVGALVSTGTKVVLAAAAMASRPASLAHSTSPTHWFGARATLTPAAPTSTAITAPTTTRRLRPSACAALRGRCSRRIHRPIAPLRTGISTRR